MIDTTNQPFELQVFIKIFIISIAIFVCSHIAINKSNHRSALGWIFVIIIFPILGSLLYFLFGINRIQRRAIKVAPSYMPNMDDFDLDQSDFDQENKGWPYAIFKTAKNLGPYPPTQGNEVEYYFEGDQIYKKMIESINNAKNLIYLQSYIFDNDNIGKIFVTALKNAIQRGVEVKVLIDDIGSHSNHGIFSELNLYKIPCLRFNQVNLLLRPSFINLRNHRKVLIIDTDCIFTGGVNISDRYSETYSSHKTVIDTHFKIKGPCIYQFMQTFLEDWNSAGPRKYEIIDREYEKLEIEKQTNNQTFKNIVGVIPDGPGKTSLRLRWHFLAAINNSTKSLKIMTPYFLPDTGVITSLISAVLRGVKVQVILPEKSDHFIVGMATIANIKPLLEYGCEIYFTPPPFNHSKIFIIDDDIILLGSSNWDDRSLRLNYELNFQLIKHDNTQTLIKYVDETLKKSHLYSFKEYQKRSLFQKIVHGLSRLATPYL